MFSQSGTCNCEFNLSPRSSDSGNIAHEIGWPIPDFDHPATDYTIEAFDPSNPRLLIPHVTGSTDEWIPKVVITDAERAD